MSSIRGKNNCYSDGGSCCKPRPECDLPSSKIYYDGEDIPEAGLVHGMPLNTVLVSLAKYIQRGINVSGSIEMESFEGISNIRLSQVPAEILLVTHCGGVLPTDAYKVSGKTMLFCKDYCLGENEFADVQVVYRVKADSSFGFNC